MITRQCQLCDTSFNFINCRKDTARFCSKSCATKYQNKKKDFGFKKGLAPWNIGLHTQIKPWIGKKFSEEHRKRLSISHIGIMAKEKNNAWKGGVTTTNKLERSKFNQTLRKLIFERDNYQCQICDSKKDLQVDHIASWAEFKELRFDPSNCRTLCSRCHYKITFKHNMPKSVKTWGHNLRRRQIL